ncbi:MAG: hypothetical protein MH213_11140 [Marinobacter sp.]|nr:hypothetical protein [Marinobacter sp.]
MVEMAGSVAGLFFTTLNNRRDQKAQTNPLLRVQAPIIAINSILGTLPDSSSITTIFSFTATGRLRSLNWGGNNCHLAAIACLPKTVQRVVCISLSGRARIAGDGSISSCG